MPIDVDQFMCRSDNFGALVRDRETGTTAIVDAPEEKAILAAIERTGWKPSLILTTHHHGDHVEANLALKQRFGLDIIAPAAEASKIPGVDRTVSEGDTIPFGKETIKVIETPGHTAGHVSYYFPASGVAFTADTLFALGCGRLFECPAPVMHQSLSKLAALPPETIVYCGHEYTLANARFALTVDPDNAALVARAPRSKNCAPKIARHCRRPSARNWRPIPSCAGPTRRSVVISAWRMPPTPRCSPRFASARIIFEGQ